MEASQAPTLGAWSCGKGQRDFQTVNATAGRTETGPVGVLTGGYAFVRPIVEVDIACESVRSSPGASSAASSDGSVVPKEEVEALAPSICTERRQADPAMGQGSLQTTSGNGIRNFQKAEMGSDPRSSNYFSANPSSSINVPVHPPQDPVHASQEQAVASAPSPSDSQGEAKTWFPGCEATQDAKEDLEAEKILNQAMPPLKRKCDSAMALDATELLVAQILSSGWARDEEPPSRSPQLSARPKACASTSGKKARENQSSVSPISHSPRSSSLDTVDGEVTPGGKRQSSHGTQSTARGAIRRPAAVPGPPAAPVPPQEWALVIVEFLQENGQDLLHAICSHYRIDYNGELSSIRDYSMEQLAHNALFNPALPKATGRLPMMLRDMPGVTDFKMIFLRDSGKIYRSVRVTAKLKGVNIVATCRACSYCGSCFSGRFMKPNAMHQQAGGWKEITNKTAAGRYSWDSLMGHRLCVPCFTHFASNGTNVNANRPSIEELIHSEGYDLSEEYASPSPTAAAASSAKGPAQRVSSKLESSAKPAGQQQQQLLEKSCNKLLKTSSREPVSRDKKTEPARDKKTEVSRDNKRSEPARDNGVQPSCDKSMEPARDKSTEPARAWLKTSTTTKARGKVGPSFDAFTAAAMSQPNCMTA